MGAGEERKTEITVGGRREGWGGEGKGRGTDLGGRRWRLGGLLVLYE